MIDSVVGAVIMVVATTSLLSAVEVIEQAFADAGRQPLSPQEQKLLNRKNRVKRVYEDGKITIEYESVFESEDPLEYENKLIQFWQDSLKTLPREVITQR